VQDLVLKAYKQCERFFQYLNSADKVPLFRLIDGKYEECGRVRRSDYRVMVPIGLTIESFSPLSAYCKDLPQIEPLLGKHAFISLSIDDLFVLKRFLPTPGSFAHYIEVRQAVAGIRRAHLFDEMDHLGAYLTKNRFDLTIAEQMADGKANMVVWDGMSEIVDKSFEGEDWEIRPLPTQDFPEEVSKLLEALDATRAPGWLSAESHIRSFGKDGRDNLGRMLSDLLPTLNQNPARYFTQLGDGKPLFIWLQKAGHLIDWKKVNDKASAAALSAKATAAIGVLLVVSDDGSYRQTQPFPVLIPKAPFMQHARIYEDAERMAQPERIVDLRLGTASPLTNKRNTIGRNERCSCGSGLKYKKCHGN
jgi:hypothetical protein